MNTSLRVAATAAVVTLAVAVGAWFALDLAAVVARGVSEVWDFIATTLSTHATLASYGAAVAVGLLANEIRRDVQGR